MCAHWSIYDVHSKLLYTMNSIIRCGCGRVKTVLFKTLLHLTSSFGIHTDTKHVVNVNELFDMKDVLITSCFM